MKAKRIKEPARWDCHCLKLITIQRAVCGLVYASADFKQCKLDRIKPRVLLELLISQTICFPFHLRHLKRAAGALIRSGITTTTAQQKRNLLSLCSFIFVFINEKKFRMEEYYKTIFLFVFDYQDSFCQCESLFVNSLWMSTPSVAASLMQLYITMLISANICNTMFCSHSHS